MSLIQSWNIREKTGLEPRNNGNLISTTVNANLSHERAAFARGNSIQNNQMSIIRMKSNVGTSNLSDS